MPKIGRNDPCACGSGLKFKKCCLEKDEAAARTQTAAVLPADHPRSHHEPDHFHCGTCDATYRMDFDQVVCTKCDGKLDETGSYEDDLDDGLHVHCRWCNELTSVPPQCACCHTGDDMPETCSHCGASLDDALPDSPAACAAGHAKGGGPVTWDGDLWLCSNCHFGVMDPGQATCQNCGVSSKDFPFFNLVDEYRKPPEFQPEDWLWCSQCSRLLQGKDLLPGEPPATDCCPFDDCDGEDYGVEMFKYFPPDGSPAPVKGMPHPKPPQLYAVDDPDGE